LLKSCGRFLFAGFTLSCVAKAMLPPYSVWITRDWDGLPIAACRTAAASSAKRIEVMVG
jgi:hypothetical protein